jgi:hypothetical protein
MTINWELQEVEASKPKVGRMGHEDGRCTRWMHKPHIFVGGGW